MQLKEFVDLALTQIVEGVVQAQKNLEGHGSLANPRLDLIYAKRDGAIVLGQVTGHEDLPVLMVNFDVGVVTTEGEHTKGGIGVATGLLTLGSMGATDKGSSAASRITFQVPLMLPPPASQQKRDRQAPYIPE
ncbi:MAG: hypothetical protein U1E83_01120 [Methylotetracoccus sp.]